MRFFRFLLITGVLFGCLCTSPNSSVLGQTTADVVRQPIIPGDARLDLTNLQPYHHTYAVYFARNGEKQRIGSLTDVLRMVDTPAGMVLERVQCTETPAGVQVDSVRALARSLAPRSHVSRNPQRTMDVTFEDDRAIGTYTPSGMEPVRVDDELSRLAFDSNWIDLLIRALPLKENYEARILTYERASEEAVDTEAIYHVRVLGREVIKVDGDNTEVFVVETERGGDGTVTRFYVGTDDHMLERLVASPAPNIEMIVEPE